MEIINGYSLMYKICSLEKIPKCRATLIRELMPCCKGKGHHYRSPLNKGAHALIFDILTSGLDPLDIKALALRGLKVLGKEIDLTKGKISRLPPFSVDPRVKSLTYSFIVILATLNRVAPFSKELVFTCLQSAAPGWKTHLSKLDAQILAHYKFLYPDTFASISLPQITPVMTQDLEHSFISDGVPLPNRPDFLAPFASREAFFQALNNVSAWLETGFATNTKLDPDFKKDVATILDQYQSVLEPKNCTYFTLETLQGPLHYPSPRNLIQRDAHSLMSDRAMVKRALTLILKQIGLEMTPFLGFVPSDRADEMILSGRLPVEESYLNGFLTHGDIAHVIGVLMALSVQGFNKEDVPKILKGLIEKNEGFSHHLFDMFLDQNPDSYYIINSAFGLTAVALTRPDFVGKLTKFFYVNRLLRQMHRFNVDAGKVVKAETSSRGSINTKRPA